MGLKLCSLSKIWITPFSANLKWTAVCCRVKQVSVWGRKNRTEKIHLRTFLALSMSIPLKNRYPVCRNSWDSGAGSSHPAMQSALHYTQEDVGKKNLCSCWKIKSNTSSRQNLCDIRGTFIPADVATKLCSPSGAMNYYFIHCETLLNMWHVARNKCFSTS